MTRNILMPSLSPTMDEGTLARWVVAEGDRFSAGDTLAEIETDKATLELEAEEDGVIVSLTVAAGTDGVKVGNVVAIAADIAGEVAPLDFPEERGSGEFDPAKIADATTGAAVTLHEVLLPAVSADVESATLARWLVAVGDVVATGDIVAEIETDKATLEVEADADGVVLSLAVAPGTDEVKVGTVIAVLSGKAGIAAEQPDSKEEGDGPDNGTVSPSLADGMDHVDAMPHLPHAVASSTSGDLKSKESVAAVQKADVGPHAAFPQDVTFETVAIPSLGRTVAHRSTEAKQQIPHIYLSVDVRVDRLSELRSDMNEVLEPRGVRLSLNDFFIKALAASLIAVPDCNVQFAGEDLLRFERADVSVVVSVPGGQVTPVIESADRKSLSAISTEMKGLAARARQSGLGAHECQGGSASISNMGMLGIKQFQAIINPPQAIILAVGATEERWTPSGEVATFLSVTGSFDHRVIDGATGARLMTTFKNLIEDPLSMMA